MEDAKVADATPEEAGDPFVAPEESRITQPREVPIGERGLTAVGGVVDVEPALVGERAPEEIVELEPEPDVPDTVSDIRARVLACADRVRKATAELTEANEAYRAACKAQVQLNAKPTLAELNAIQRRVTATETRRKARAMKALGELGFGDSARPKPHPPLFRSE